MGLPLLVHMALLAIFSSVAVCQTSDDYVAEDIRSADASGGAPTAAAVSNWSLDLKLSEGNSRGAEVNTLEGGSLSAFRDVVAQNNTSEKLPDLTSFSLTNLRAQTALPLENDLNATELINGTTTEFLNETQGTTTAYQENVTESAVLSETSSGTVETTTEGFMNTTDRNVTYAESPDNYVVIGSSMFATLDNAWPHAPIANDFCASSYGSNVPEGWQVAEDSHDSRIAIELNTFGTPHIVLANATYTHQLTLVNGKVEQLTDGSVRASAECPNRILIKRIEPVETPVDVYTEKEITNFITFNGRDYAMINNAPVTAAMEGGCDHVFYKVPDGWSVADDNNDTLAVIMTPKCPFMYICKVTSSGKAYDFTLGSSKDFDVCQGNNQLVTVQSVELGATIVSISVNNCGAIMISRPDTSMQPSWVSGPLELTNTYIANIQGHTYATLDNTAPSTKYSDVWQVDCKNCCQNVAMALPDGWVVATPEMAGYGNAAAQQWGTDCIGGTNHLGQPCNYTFTATSDYATVRSCDQKVLIKREPQNCVSDWTAWSACPSQCPATQSRTRTDIKRDAMYGGTCDRTQARNCTDSQCNASLVDRSENTSAALAQLPSLITGFFAVFSLILLSQLA